MHWDDPAMEGAMLTIRLIKTGAAFLLVSGMAAGSAAAQTAAEQAPGKPIQLLRIVEQSTKTKTRVHPKLATAAAKNTRTHSVVAERKHHHLPTATAAAAPPAGLWSAANRDATTDVAAAEPAPQPLTAAGEPALGQLVVGGQTVQVESRDAVNEIDRAANDAASKVPTPEPGNTAANTASPSAPGDLVASVAPPTDAADMPKMTEVSDTALKSDLATATAPQPASRVGSPAWIAQVLAALGGAVAAGSVAWFLIGSAPQRTYG
jgi:hypothetical protein